MLSGSDLAKSYTLHTHMFHVVTALNILQVVTSEVNGYSEELHPAWQSTYVRACHDINLCALLK